MSTKGEDRTNWSLTYFFATVCNFAFSLPSGFYGEVISDDGTTEGDAILSRFGFTINGEP